MKQLLATSLVIAALVAPVAWFFGSAEPPAAQVVAPKAPKPANGIIDLARSVSAAAEHRTDAQADAMLDEMHRIAEGLSGLATDDRGAPLPAPAPVIAAAARASTADPGMRAAARAAGEGRGGAAAFALNVANASADNRERPVLAGAAAAPAGLPTAVGTLVRYASLPSGWGSGRGAYRFAGAIGAPAWLQREYPTVVAWYYLA